MRRKNLVRAAGLAGVLASAAYVVGDVLLLGRKVEPAAHPALVAIDGVDEPVLSMVPSSTARLTAGALAGVYATPLYLAAVWHLHEGLAPAGPRRALPPALILAGAWTWASFVHGSFFHTGQSYKDLEELADDARARERLLATATAFERATISAYVPFGAAVVVASALIVDAVRRGDTAYPRWSGPIVAPLAPIAAATALTASHVLPGPARHALQGAGISLGNLVSLGASTVLLWRDRRSGHR
ncbi:DUF6796 family protein [Pseudonocardia endophytica]|uniref:DUF998 domain-containing protein n=1 Tax=Pseudonocardia endophytica TaxID=401976 RepID=A0A4R1HU49_PSEEN|nr:DUF6796 family protein [Pseudonocardia endophytica]TCK26214.1 hypothetical protein EV378_2043 [Pseudonocardia endophytica]